VPLSAVIDRLLIATQNAHKVGEIQRFLAELSIPIESLTDYPAVDAPDEDQTTFEGNALLKARYYSEHFNMPCVADDSGLAVDALEGAPGVYSARYAGETATDDENNQKLLRMMEGVPDDCRSARFVCCAALVTPAVVEHVVRGTVEGRIAHECSGSNGFGYDVLFVPEGYDETFGVLDPSVKAGFSHRAKAFGLIKQFLER
jgi:non-canonical purine NTP pyrophosphatase (RdgB/HAM1 family)